MDERLLADEYLGDVVERAGGPFANAAEAALVLGARVIVALLPVGLSVLADDSTAYVAGAGLAALGIAQLLLVRAGVGHRDGDVTALSEKLISRRKTKSTISTRLL